MDLAELFAAAADDERRGATEIERRLLRALLDVRQAWTHDGLMRGADVLGERSSMANLRTLADLVLSADDLDMLEDDLRSRAEVIASLDRLLAEAGCRVVSQVGRVVTISRSSAVEAVLVGAAARGWRGRIVVLDGTPSGCGAVQAGRLAERGLEVTSLPDGAMNEALGFRPREVVVLTGADAVGRNRFVNVQGTGLLCECAAHREIRTAIVADTAKDVAATVIDQLLSVGRRQWEPGPGRAWSAFEAVPTDFVTDRISERGCATLPPPGP